MGNVCVKKKTPILTVVFRYILLKPRDNYRDNFRANWPLHYNLCVTVHVINTGHVFGGMGNRFFEKLSVR